MQRDLISLPGKAPVTKRAAFCMPNAVRRAGTGFQRPKILFHKRIPKQGGKAPPISCFRLKHLDFRGFGSNCLQLDIFFGAQKRPGRSLCRVFSLEASVGIGPTNEGFADPCLTAWLRRPDGLSPCWYIVLQGDGKCKPEIPASKKPYRIHQQAIFLHQKSLAFTG